MGFNWQEFEEKLSARGGPQVQHGHSEQDDVKLIPYSFEPKKYKSIELMHLTDLQIGSKNFLRKRFIEYRDWILAVPNRFVLLGGDIIDAATVLSIASPYDNVEEPKAQINTAVGLLGPLRDAGRLLAYVGGNHERRTSKTFGDCGSLIAEKLDVPYSCGVQLIDITYGNHNPYKVALWHGGGSARTDGAKMQMLSRFRARFPGSQLYLVGHLHDAFLKFWWPLRRVGHRIKQEKTCGMMSSSFQGFWNSYAEVAALEASDTLMWRVILTPDGKWEVTAR